MESKEIDRLLRISSDSIRTGWENKRNNGLSLSVVDDARKIAMAQAAKYGRWSVLGVVMAYAGIIIGIGILYNVVPLPNNTKAAYGVIACVASIVSFSLIALLMIETRQTHEKAVVIRYDSIFENFARSLTAINPQGTSSDQQNVVNAKYVHDRAVTLAVQLLTAQHAFDNLRTNRNASRFTVVQSGEQLSKCEDEFNAFEKACREDFGITLDKSYIFQMANDYISKSRQRE